MHRFLYHSRRVPAWLLLVMTLPYAAARAQTFLTAPLNISGTSQALIPSIAAGPNGEIDVVWLDSNAILFRRTLDAGKTFSPTMKVATVDLPSQPSQPQIAANSSGVYVAWAGTNSSGQGDVFLSALASNASTWSTPLNLSGGKGIASGSAPVPHMVAEPGGAVDIAWGQTAAYFARSTDGGNNFALTWLSGSAMQRVSPRIAIGGLGSIDVVWVKADPNFPNCSGPTIEFARSTNGGLTFGGPYSVADNLTVNGQPVTGCTSDVQIAPGANNTIHLLWANENTQIRDLIVTYATDDDSTFPFSGSTFPETPSTFFNISTTGSYTPEMAIDSSGNINVVWTGDASNSDSRQLIYFSRSDNTSTQPAGEKFSNPQPLTGPPASGSKATGFPQIAAEVSGAIDILWQQASAANPGNAYDIVLKRSTDGASFQPFTLDNSPTITGDTGELAVDTSGNVYAVWLGNLGSSADVMLNGDSKALPDPGFSLTISTSSQTVLPGSALSLNVTVSSTVGSAQNVGLSCSSEPAGAQCSFAPGTVTVSLGSATSTLTLTLPQTIGAGTYSVTVMGSSSGSMQTVSTTFVVGGLTASVSPASATINVGSSASFTVSLTSTGFSGSMTLGCSAPAGISCGFSPGSVSLASGAASSTLNVSVTAKPAAAAPHHPGRDFGWRPQDDPAIAVWIWSIGLLALLGIVIASRRNASGLRVERAENRNTLGYKALALARAAALSLLLAAVATGITSCGGSASNGGGGGGGSNNFPLIVQAKTSSGTTNLQTISITVP